MVRRQDEEEQVVEQQLPIIDCLIFAYTNSTEGEIDMILLATVYACDIPP